MCDMRQGISRIKYILAAILAGLILAGCGVPEEYLSDIPITEAPEASREPNAAETSPTAVVAAMDSIAEDGVYDSRDDVALYIVTYGHLPDNYITKKEAKALGWEGGSLKEYAPDKCIGGDYFGNYEGLLPEDDDYRECDIGTLGKKSRGAKRIIYSDDGDVYYTEDHYESFTQLYEEYERVYD